MQLLQVFRSESHSNVFYILKEYHDLFFTSSLANLRNVQVLLTPVTTTLFTSPFGCDIFSISTFENLLQ